MSKTKPVHEIRIGAIRASVWENSVGDATKFNVTFSRIYKDGEEWKYSDSFSREDLLLLAKVADKAHTWVYENRPAKEPAAAREQWNKRP